ncbi:hypothetical protein DUNSADRAFT_2922 [Dunaliella salina]|uniref:Encoded protein n=1 Tax=Dunaliella salina TaxID=3046 RepID=A0ABQ7GUU8_DUNSA|nr:hypothetical protein DUNSADRAFT_2922 [Dunaliella salina]|eukprot:KAF5838386.1 hypothetical protein DUNSADRAFT_2922 [Dunaliella salina]
MRRRPTAANLPILFAERPSCCCDSCHRTSLYSSQAGSSVRQVCLSEEQQALGLLPHIVAAPLDTSFISKLNASSSSSSRKRIGRKPS